MSERLHYLAQAAFMEETPSLSDYGVVSCDVWVNRLINVELRSQNLMRIIDGLRTCA